MSQTITVRDAAELADALQQPGAVIEVAGEISGSPMLTLPPGVTLRGGTLRFGAKGVRLTTDNTLDGVRIEVPDHEVAILNDTSVADLGTLRLRDVTTRGQIALFAADAVRAGHVVAEGVRVEAADVRGRFDRPHGFGVEALQGGFTLWNRQPDAAVTITAELRDISVGSEQEPVRGSGIFVGGHGDWDGKGDGGTLRVTELRCGDVVTDGGIAPGTPDLISGGVFVISGAEVDLVSCVGAVTTLGQNDMVLDNWGRVTRWEASAPVTSHGPSGIGFVNFGDIDVLDVTAPIVTTGKGARGFNLYDGSLREASFASIATTGDGSMGIQVSKPLGTLRVAGDVTTSGGTGLSLVKGVQVTLQAIALSVKPGGVVDRLEIGGALKTSGDEVVTLELAGEVRECEIRGGVEATGAGSDAAHVAADTALPDGIELTAAAGELVRRI